MNMPFQYLSGGSEPGLVEAATAQLKKWPFYHSFWNHTTNPSLVCWTSYILPTSFIYLKII